MPSAFFRTRFAFRGKNFLCAIFFDGAKKTTFDGFTDFSTSLRKTGHFPEPGEGKRGNRLQNLLPLFYSFTLTPIFDRFIYIIR